MFPSTGRKQNGKDLRHKVKKAAEHFGRVPGKHWGESGSGDPAALPAAAHPRSGDRLYVRNVWPPADSRKPGVRNAAVIRTLLRRDLGGIFDHLVP